MFMGKNGSRCTSGCCESNVEFFRLLMIREPGEVVCLHHYLDDEVEFVEHDQYSWIWNAADFSEGEIVNEKFRLTFNSRDSAAAFKAAVDSVLVSVKFSLSGKIRNVDG